MSVWDRASGVKEGLSRSEVPQCTSATGPGIAVAVFWADNQEWLPLMDL
jgi:hypothetical protein